MPEETAAPEPPPPPPIPDPALAHNAWPVLSPLTAATVDHIRSIAGRSERLQNNVFAKMGGSSIESHAFLHCFGSSRNVELGEHSDLQAGIDFFRDGRAPRRNSFVRESLAAQVGWSLRHGLTGRPPRYLEEIRAINARYALVFFGGNDVQGRDAIAFGERLQEMVEELSRRGVVPILGATSPRSDDPAMDVWAQRYNRVSRGIAQAWNLPYLDFYAAQVGLLRHGLAGDGVHSNVFQAEGRGRPCDFTTAGLERGMNVRNLQTMRMLDRTRQVLDEAWDGEFALDANEDVYGDGSVAQPQRLAELPYAERLVVSEAMQKVYRFRLEAPLRFVATLLGRGNATGELQLFGEEPSGEAMQSGAHLRGELEAGVYHLVVVGQAGEAHARDEAALTLIIDEDAPPMPEQRRRRRRRRPTPDSAMAAEMAPDMAPAAATTPNAPAPQ